MHPILFHIGPLVVRTYGALVALAFLVALRVARWGAHLRKIDEVFLLDLTAVLVLSGLIGARLLYVLLNMTYYVEHPWDSVKIWEGGLVFYGGFLLASAAGIWYVRWKGFSVGKVADILAPALALGQAVGRWACFFAGCCYGRPTTLPWGIRFSDPASLAPLGVDLHPTQLYESFGDLLIGLVLWLQLIRKKDSDGEIFWLYILLYAALRFGVEFARGDDRGPTIGGLYPSQLIALIAMLVSASVLIAQAASKSNFNHGPITENYQRR